MSEETKVKKQDETSEEKKKSSSGKEFLRDVLVFIIACAVLFVLNSTVLINAKIPAESMETTLMTHDRVIGNRLAYKNKDPERFDIVIFKYPDDESQYFVKRIIGLPGDTILVKNGKVYINGSKTPLPDNFCQFTDTTPTNSGDGVFKVPANHYFMMGDNRNDSLDSRFWYNKYVARDKITAKVVYIYWPFTHVKGIKYSNWKNEITPEMPPTAASQR